MLVGCTGWMKRGAPTFKSWKVCFCLRAFEHFEQISRHLSLYPVKERTTLVNHQMLKYLVYFKMGTVLYIDCILITKVRVVIELFKLLLRESILLLLLSLLIHTTKL